VGATVVPLLVDVIAARVGWRGGCLDVWIAGPKGSNCGSFFLARFAGGGCGIGGMSVEDWALVDMSILAKTPPGASILRKRLFTAAERLPLGGTRGASGRDLLVVLTARFSSRSNLKKIEIRKTSVGATPYLRSLLPEKAKMPEPLTPQTQALAPLD
jgi:hypothetical protein